MTKKFWKAAIIRAVRTICQTVLALIGTATFVHEVNWVAILSASFMSGLVSIATSVVTGLPEAKGTKETSTETEVLK